MSKDDQMILAFPSKSIKNYPLGIGGLDEKAELFKEATYYRRGDIEEDESLKQIIPYIIIRHGENIFRYQRGKTGGEARLHGSWSIGLGGHIEKEEFNPQGIGSVYAAAYRELFEEVWLTPEHINKMAVTGFVNTNENAVSRVHFGVVFICDVNHPEDVKPNEECISYPGWISRNEIESFSLRYEAWSRHALKLLPFTE